MRTIDEDIRLSYSTEDTYNPRNQSELQDSTWYYDTYNIGKNYTHKAFEPWFAGTNNETGYLMHLIINNPILLGLVITKCDILRGKKLTLFNTLEKDKDGHPMRLDQSDWPSEIEDFYEFNDLNLWAYNSFFYHEVIGNAFSEGIFSMGSSRSAKIVTEINTITPECVRAVRAEKVRKRIIEYGLSENWRKGLIQKDVERIPAWYHKDFYDQDRKFSREPAGNNILFHAKRDMPHFPIYAIPRWYGARHMIETQNLVPLFHKNNLKNLFGLRMQMSISRALMERKMEQGDGKGTRYSEQQVLDMLAADATKFFTNPKNAGKSVAGVHEFDHQGRALKDLMFDKIQVDMNDDAYAPLDTMMSQSVTSSMGTSPSLAGIIAKNSLPSGSEQRYAWNIEVVKGAYLRDLILQPLRFTHNFNEWDKNLVWGFEDAIMVTADENKNGMVPATNQPPKTQDNAV